VLDVRLSARAKRDLAEIAFFIAEDSPARAQSFVTELEEVCLQLGTMPRAFPLLPRHRRTGIRKRLYGDYLIFYLVLTKTVEIVHILHGARDYEAILFPED
jgi:plasmid stabilization system protein ParE